MRRGRDPGDSFVEPRYSYSYSLSPYGMASPRRPPFFGRTELRHIAIAVGVLTVALTMVLWDRNDVSVLPATLALAASAVLLGFFLHEMAHKVMAKKYGCWAEFRAYNSGLLLALAMSLFGFLFAAPGAVYISGRVTKEQNGRISLAGPATNLSVALLLIASMLLLVTVTDQVPGWVETFTGVLVFFNVFLAVFNMLPVPPLDGSKVWAWNKPLYVVVMAAAVSLLVLAWL